MAEDKLPLGEQWHRVAGFGFLVFIVAYMWLLWHHLHTLEDFCQQVHPGMAVADVRDLLTRQRLVADSSIPPLDHGTYLLSVPAPMATGDKTCRIYHDGRVVVRVELK